MQNILAILYFCSRIFGAAIFFSHIYFSILLYFFANWKLGQNQNNVSLW